MTTTTGIGVHDQNIERQIEKHMAGCMAGFFNLFDRSPTKRLYPKRLPPPLPSLVVDLTSEPDSSAVQSPVGSRELVKKRVQLSPKPDLNPNPVRIPDSPKSPITVKSPLLPPSPSPSPWKFAQAPRLSLDSRAVVDAKGSLRPREIKINTTSSTADEEDRDNQKRSPSVVARLMGLDRLPSSTATTATPQPEEKKVELRRSASESRSRDYNRFFDTSIFISPTAVPETAVVREKKSERRSNSEKTNEVKQSERNQRRVTVMEKRRSYYNTADFYPPEKCQQNNQAVSIYGEIERRLKMRGIDEPSKDLEKLKNILEALQLKGLLHSNSSQRSQNVVVEESPIVVMKPVSTGVVSTRRRMNGGESSMSPRTEKPQVASKRNKRSTSPVRRKGGPPPSIETQRRGNETTSPRMRRNGVFDNQTVNMSPRNRRSTVEIGQGDKERLVGCPVEDEVSTVSESSVGTSSHADNERWRVEEYREGRNLLERCDKLLHSIAEMTCNTNSAELQQPSPVSVLDPSFYKEDESSPSPVKKRTIDFKDQVVVDVEDEIWSPSSSTQLFPKLDQDMDSSDDSELSYVSKVLRASNYLPDESNLFHLLEKQNSIRGNKDRSKASILQRKLIFDTITEILDRNRQLPPWKAALMANEGQGRPMLDQIWSEFQKIRERDPSDDLLEVVCGILKKDLAGDSINGWGDCHVEISEAVLDIERLIFKDLIGETIRDLVAFGGKNVGIYALRRKLIF